MRQTILACALLAATSAASADTYTLRVYARGIVSAPVEAPPPVETLPPPAEPGKLELSLSEWDFGSITIGAPSSKSFTLMNSGGSEAPVSFSNISAPFSVLDNQCGASLEPAITCDFTVQYQPTTSTEDSVTLAITGTTPGAELSLFGRGTAPATSWKSVNLGRHNWYAMAFGAGRFVALANNQINYTTDGVSWSTITPAAGYPTSFRSMTYGAGKFVAVSIPVSGRSYAGTSVDGLNWTFTAMPTGNWTGVAEGNGRFVAIDSTQTAPRTAYSSDGVNWTVASAQTLLKNVAFGNGRFVAATANNLNRVAVSADGITWSNRTLPSPIMGAVSFANGRFIVMGGTSAMISADGESWAQVALPRDMRQAPRVAYGNGKYMAVEGLNGVGFGITSTDGVTWTQVTMPGADWTTLAFGNGVFVATPFNYSIVGYTN